LVISTPQTVDFIFIFVFYLYLYLYVYVWLGLRLRLEVVEVRALEPDRTVPGNITLGNGMIVREDLLLD